MRCTVEAVKCLIEYDEFYFCALIKSKQGDL